MLRIGLSSHAGGFFEPASGHFPRPVGHNAPEAQKKKGRLHSTPGKEPTLNGLQGLCGYAWRAAVSDCLSVTSKSAPAARCTGHTGIITLP